jgi:hypothetical protein
MTERSTQPIGVEGASDPRIPWQRDEITWSFGAGATRIVGWPDLSRATGAPQDSGNRTSSLTSGPQSIEPPETPTMIPERAGYGKRALQPLYEWEGVVERVEKDGFRCRMVPLIHGGADRGKVELTDFSFDDLAADSDQSLVVPGAIFYWTVGRARNAAGTVTNLSLLRFRRLLPPTSAQTSLAEHEAFDLLRALDDDGSHSAAE